MDVNSFWQWYWANKAQIDVPHIPVVDIFGYLWNWAMMLDFVRGLALLVVPVWTVLGFGDLAIEIFRRREGSGVVLELPTAEPVPDQAQHEKELTGDFLKSELERLGKTQSDLAKVMGISRSYVSHWLSGKKAIAPEHKQRIRDILSLWDSER